MARKGEVQKCAVVVVHLLGYGASVSSSAWMALIAFTLVLAAIVILLRQVRRPWLPC